jgi:carbonic anhydrase
MQSKLRITLLALAVAVSSFAASRDFWHELQLGNARFAAGQIKYEHLNQERIRDIDHQYPPVTVLSCADSRVPPELVFAHSIGELFVVRVAGNVTDDFPLASIEYAVMPPRQWTKLLVVMGHQNCGAVDAAIKTANPGPDPLGRLIARIKQNIGGVTDLTEATKLNARKSAKYLIDNSAIIHTAVCSGQLQIKPAYYDMRDGRVTELAPLPPSVPCH